ncbi:hypothetical protein INT44_004710 [Umbelopsis vinacea]|uniref:YTH domain-containing protein n=1 Tax=Umbelopsis vinacea TaxID=44442 RepID=A0A8H7PG04_9FUNG|nr:hypothetical protein INT44_004710 [Umbelopsis vinacea]
MSDASPPPPVAEIATPPSDSPKPASGIQQKPKNLENAMWVGNLPTDTTPEELRDFFFDDDFLQASRHDIVCMKSTEFHGIKLVCRPRKVSGPVTSLGSFGHPLMNPFVQQNHLTARGMVASPRHLHTSLQQTSASDAMPMLPPPMMYLPQGGVTGSMRFNQYPGDPRFHTLSTMPPTSMPQHPTTSSPTDYRPRRTSQLSRSSRDSSPAQPPLPSPQERHPSIDSNASNPSVRYFILKSLTADDLDISVERGVWATQPHNEASLNRAFKTSSAVYLIFSANKSGEFYGYARMLQPIVPNPPSSPSTQVEWTPITMEEEEEEGNAPPTEKEQPPVDGNEKRWGNAFKVQWIKVQTRHLRNSWNNNREVKVSRDGTELETAVGEMLLQGFHWAEQQQLYQQQPQAPPPYQPMMYNNEMPPSQQMMMGYIQTPHGLQLVPIPFVGLGMPPTPYPYMFSTQDDAQ